MHEAYGNAFFSVFSNPSNPNLIYLYSIALMPYDENCKNLRIWYLVYDILCKLENLEKSLKKAFIIYG